MIKMPELYIRLAIAIGTTIGTVGCSSFYKPSPVLSTRSNALIPWEDGRWFWPGEKRVLLNPYTYNPTNGAVVATNQTDSLYYVASHSTDSNKAKQARNQLQDAVIRISDQMTAHHLSALKGTENNANMLLGSAAMGLTGGASVAGEATAKALAAAATGVIGARELFNDQVYRNALVETLIAAIETDRADYLERVIHTRQKLPVQDYNVEAALRDAHVYHYRGSFYHGLTLIRDAAEKENNRRREAVRVKQQADINQTKQPAKNPETNTTPE